MSILLGSVVLPVAAASNTICSTPPPSPICPIPERAEETLPSKPPRTTTLEPFVNPTGLSNPPRYGWRADFIGFGRGYFDLSLGVQFWSDRFVFRNLIFGGMVDVLPGMRVRAGLRRREGERQAFQIDTDEAYLELFRQYRAPTGEGGVNLRVGRVRYLHFPYPDAIAVFDQVPGIGDLTGGPATDFRSILFQAEAALYSGWGAHGGALLGNFLGGKSGSGNIVEAYGFYRSSFGRGWRFEGRLGYLAVRQEPLGRAAQPGLNVYVGKQVGEFHIGLLYERKRAEPEYSGIMVQFRPGPVTRTLGKITLDYARTPQGLSMQLPLWHGRLRQSRAARPGDVLVGEVSAVRLRTLWQQSFVRNQYEHRLDSWGETSDPTLRCVVVEEPWYLQAEALVSPHLVPDARWERDRQGPAQYAQRVTYRFYRATGQRPDNL